MAKACLPKSSCIISFTQTCMNAFINSSNICQAPRMCQDHARHRGAKKVLFQSPWNCHIMGDVDVNDLISESVHIANVESKRYYEAVHREINPL